MTRRFLVVSYYIVSIHTIALYLEKKKKQKSDKNTSASSKPVNKKYKQYVPKLYTIVMNIYFTWNIWQDFKVINVMWLYWPNVQ